MAKSSDQQVDGRVWVKVRSLSPAGFWRAKILWTPQEAYRKVARGLAETLIAERNLVATVVQRPPEGWTEDGGFCPPAKAGK